MTDIETAWLAGLLEGEGSFLLTNGSNGHRYPRVQVQMCDEDVIERVAKLFGTSVYYPKNHGGQVKPVYKTMATAGTAVRIMEAILPHMGERRADKIREVLGC